MSQPLIAVTSGEPAGIGPELCLKLADWSGAGHPVVLGDRDLLAERAAGLGWSITLRDYMPGQSAAAGHLDVLHLPLAKPAQAGLLDPANGPYVLKLLDRALLVLDETADDAERRRQDLGEITLDRRSGEILVDAARGAVGGGDDADRDGDRRGTL